MYCKVSIKCYNRKCYCRTSVVLMKTLCLLEVNMNEFMNSMAGVAWSIIPILLIFFLMAGIMFVFYFKKKTEEVSSYIKSIAASLERLSNR